MSACTAAAANWEDSKRSTFSLFVLVSVGEENADLRAAMDGFELDVWTQSSLEVVLEHHRKRQVNVAPTTQETCQPGLVVPQASTVSL